MKDKFKQAHMDVAERYAELSSAVRLHVGCIIVKDNRVLSIGYNGMPSGWSNVCERSDKITVHSKEDGDEMIKRGYTPVAGTNQGGVYEKLTSLPEVLHAETNAIAKLAKSHESGDGAALFVTHSPCIDCAKLIHQAGITEVYFKHEYRSTEGWDFLRRCNIRVEHLE
jgi:dCMP deaminase